VVNNEAAEGDGVVNDEAAEGAVFAQRIKKSRKYALLLSMCSAECVCAACSDECVCAVPCVCA
jgi:hypothetical protein